MVELYQGSNNEQVQVNSVILNRANDTSPSHSTFDMTSTKFQHGNGMMVTKDGA